MDKAEVLYEQNAKEYWFQEGCFIQEIANNPGDEDVSIARVRVPGGGKTLFHALEGVTERYIIISGRGRMELGEKDSFEVGPGDVVRIPSYVKQCIANLLETDLIFYAICSPRFIPASYVAVQD